MKLLKPVILLLVVSSLFILNCSKPDVWEMNNWYSQLSRFKDSETEAFALHLKTFEEEKIQKIADFYLEKHGNEDHYLLIHFYDNRSFVPDYSKGVDYTEAQGEHIIARFFYNPFTEEKRMEFLQ